MSNRNHGLGWIRDRADGRDLVYRSARPLAALPIRADLRDDPDMARIPVTNQGSLGSCTGQALAAALAFVMQKNGESFEALSPLFIYWNERYVEGTVSADRGAQIRTGAKVLSWWGGCAERLWPYNARMFRRQPSREAFIHGATNRVVEYRRVTGLNDLRGALAEGFPVVFGFQVYEGFEAAEVSRTGEAAMPKRGERLIGGHAVLAVGYDDERGVVICRNSWGADWGDGGYFTLPYVCIQSARLSADFWVLTRCL